MEGLSLPTLIKYPHLFRGSPRDFLPFFGAKKEAKKHPPPPRPPPIWGGCNCLRGKTALRQGFGMARKACALRASHDYYLKSTIRSAMPLI